MFFSSIKEHCRETKRWHLSFSKYLSHPPQAALLIYQKEALKTMAYSYRCKSQSNVCVVLMAVFKHLTEKPPFLNMFSPVKDPVGVSYLLRCPYCQCREFPWLRHNLLPSILAGTHSASHFGPVCISHCCCTNQGSPLLKQIKKKHKWFKYCNNTKRKKTIQTRDTYWEQALRTAQIL